MQLVMFDIDGTLVESVRVDDACFVQALTDVFGLADINTEWSTYPHCTDGAILETIFQDRRGRLPKADEIATVQERFVALLTAATCGVPFAEIPGAGACLSRLRADPDRTVSLATGAWERSARVKLAAAHPALSGIPGAFAEDGPSRESIMKASYLRAARACGRDGFESVVYVGDGVWDVRASKNLGWPCLGIARDPAKAARLRAEGARHVVDDYRDLENFSQALQAVQD